MSVDVDVAEGGTVMSQKRFDPGPLDDESTTNAAFRPPTPPISIPSDLDRLWEEVTGPGIDWSIPQPESPGSSGSVGSNQPSYAPPDPGSPTGSHPGPPQSVGRFPSQPGWPALNTGTLSSTGHQQTPPQSPTVTGGSPLPPLPHPGPSESDEHPPSPPAAAPLDMDTLSSTGHQPTPPQSPTGGTLPPPPHPGLSDEHPPSSPAASLDMDTLSSTGHQPTPPPSPGQDSGAHPPSNPEPQPPALEAESGDLLSKVFKGKIKPRMI